MIKIQSEATQFLCQKLQGGNVKVVLTDEKTKPITIRLDDPTLKIIEEYVSETGFSRNVVMTFLLQGGMELVAMQMQQADEQTTFVFGGKRA